MSTPVDEIHPQDGFGLVRSYTRHLVFVREALQAVEQELAHRALVHDASKMLDDEFGGFSRINAAARINKYGSPEYKAGMERERGTIDLHFSRNSHHPEHHLPDNYQIQVAPKALDMSFIDIIEMVCDWWGARKGYGDRRAWEDSVQLNFEHKAKYLTPEQLWLAKQVAEFLGKTLPS